MNEELEAMTSEEAADVETSEASEQEAQEAEQAETEVEKGEEQADPPAASEQATGEDIESLKAQLAAFKTKATDEVGKRQQLEAKLKEYEESKEKPDIFEAPDEFIGSLKNDVNNQLNSVVTNLSEELARGKFDDFDDVLSEVVAMQETNPEGLRQIMAHAVPGLKYGESIYKAYKNQKILTESGGADALMSKISELESQLAELSKKPQTQVPPDLTTARSAGGDEQVTVADGNEGLESLLGR